jgi:hypothetical protein
MAKSFFSAAPATAHILRGLQAGMAAKPHRICALAGGLKFI